MATIVFEPCIVSFGSPSSFATDKELQYLSKFMTIACKYSSAEHLTTTVYHQKTSGQAETLKEAIVTRLQLHVVDHQ